MALSDRNEININLSDEGILTNSWITLEGAYARIGLYSNNAIYISPRDTQFYFDEDNELIFVRHTHGAPEKIDQDHPLKKGYVIVPHLGVDYQIKLYEGGIEDNTVGVYHDVYSLDNVVGFFK